MRESPNAQADSTENITLPSLQYQKEPNTVNTGGSCLTFLVMPYISPTYAEF